MGRWAFLPSSPIDRSTYERRRPHPCACRTASAVVNASSFHDIQRIYISTLLDSGANPVTVSELAGHTSMTTMAKFDRHGEGAKRAAILKMTIPHVSQRALSRDQKAGAA